MSIFLLFTDTCATNTQKAPQRYKKSRKHSHPTPLKYINNVNLSFDIPVSSQADGEKQQITLPLNKKNTIFAQKFNEHQHHIAQTSLPS